MPGEFHYTPPSEAALDVIHSDEQILIINKSAGLLSVPGKAEDHADCLEHRVKAAFPQALLVHRLDLHTSGLMIFAQNRKAQRHLGLQFERRHISKNYVAVVAGVMPIKIGQIDLPLISDWPKRPLQMVDWERGRKASTSFMVVEQHDETTRVALYPVTGRTHQLRVHCLAMGHPILGDSFYAPDRWRNASPRLLLHAQSLSLYHPDGGDRVAFFSPTPF
ncbi:MAG: RluA family pseudouridine synthase [Rhizobiales bacterium]|nr:RluA family pseudouridine synthase [Hyphomicrobiales bacterium]